MTGDQYVAAILQKYAINAGTAKAAGDSVAPAIRAWAGSQLASLTYSGSFAKGTANSPSTDVDLFISLKADTRETLKKIYESLYTYAAQQRWSPVRQNVSIGNSYNGVKLDLVPGVLLYRLWSRCLDAVVIVKPETIVRWHRLGFRAFWSWKSRPRGPGRPSVPPDIKSLIKCISRDNILWGAPRIHGELLKLGIETSQATVSKYMMRHPKPPSQTWLTFLRNHLECLASIDFFVVPTATFRILFVFIVLQHQRRRILHIGVTANPTSQWTSQQIREAFPWDSAPRYLIRDRDASYGCRVPVTAECDRYHRGIERSALTLAECPCRTTHRLNPT
jgi:hypothetical protein